MDERAALAAALKAVTDRTPLITRGVVNANQSSKPIDWRKVELAKSIGQTRALLDDLLLQEVRAGWRRRGDAA